MPPLLLTAALPRPTCAGWLDAVAAAGNASLALPALPGLDAGAVLQAIADSALRGPLEAALGTAPWCNVDQSWLRHGRPPHHWHQDGALGFDFLAHRAPSPPAGALLEMLSCWIALTPCGASAPGLEWVDAPLDRLLWPAELTDTAVASAFAPQLRGRPVMQPGDALLFDGHLLHRTHLDATMMLPRSSLELRFFRAGSVPPRLAGQRFVALPDRSIALR